MPPVAAILTGLILVASPEPAAEGDDATAVQAVSEPEPAPGLSIHNAFVRVRGMAHSDLARALELRAPGLTVRDATRESLKTQPGELWAFIDVRPIDEAYALTIILSDGRGYDREVEGSHEDGPRTTAVAIANLLAAIAENRVEADRADAEVPDEVEAAVEEAPEPEPEPEPEPVVETAVDEARWSIAPGLAGGALLGLGPPSDTNLLTAAGGTAAIRLISPQRWAFGVDVRVAGRRGQRYRLMRTRIAAAFGHHFRRRGFALASVLRLSVEPWGVRRRGERVAVERGDRGSLAPGVLLGASVGISPGWSADVGRATLTLGVPIELGYSGVPDGGLAAARVELFDDSGREALFRAGGLELQLGLGITVELPGPRARAKKSATPTP